MWISHEASQSFALAAAVAGDRGASRALAGLSATSEAIAHCAQELASMAAGQRQQRLSAWAQAATRFSGDVPPSDHPRALSLLAGHVQPALGRQLLASAPAPRPGFVAEPELLRLLGHIWRSTTS